MTDPALIEKLHAAVEAQRDTIIQFLREICAIPSMDSQLGEVGERVAEEMKKLGFDEVRFDKMGNIFGRVGTGPTVIVYDSHIDTVGIGDPDSWEWDPFTGKVEDGVFFARGACDEKGSTPGMIYGIALGRDLGQPARTGCPGECGHPRRVQDRRREVRERHDAGYHPSARQAPAGQDQRQRFLQLVGEGHATDCIGGDVDGAGPGPNLDR